MQNSSPRAFFPSLWPQLAEAEYFQSLRTLLPKTESVSRIATVLELSQRHPGQLQVAGSACSMRSSALCCNPPTTHATMSCSRQLLVCSCTCPCHLFMPLALGYKCCLPLAIWEHFSSLSPVFTSGSLFSWKKKNHQKLVCCAVLSRDVYSSWVSLGTLGISTCSDTCWQAWIYVLYML